MKNSPRHKYAILLALLIGHVAGAQERVPAAKARLAPPLRDLLKAVEDAEGHEQDAVVASVQKLAEARTWRESDYSGGGHLVRSQAVVQRWHNQDRVVLVLNFVFPSTPGPHEQRLLLLDKRGRVLDRVSCTISNRLQWSGSFDAAVPKPTDKTNADVIIRYTPAHENAGISGNWAHEIVHRGREGTFSWDVDDHVEKERPDREAQGLCRVRVGRKRFEVVFPHLQAAMRRISLREANLFRKRFIERCMQKLPQEVTVQYIGLLGTDNGRHKLKLTLATPSDILRAVVGQDLLRLTIRRETAA